MIASENEPKKHEKKYVYFNEKNGVKIVSPQAPHFIQEKVFEFDPTGLCVESGSNAVVKNDFYSTEQGYLVDGRKVIQKINVNYYFDNLYPYFTEFKEIFQNHLEQQTVNLQIELQSIRELQKLNKNGCKLTSSYLNTLDERKEQIDKLNELKKINIDYSEQGESKKFVGNGIFYIERKDIRNIYRSDYVPFFIFPPSTYSYQMATVHLSETELSSLGITAYDLEKIVIGVNYEDTSKGVKPTSICLINRDRLDRGDTIKLDLNHETSENSFTISIKINRNSLTGKIHLPSISDLSLDELKSRCFDLNFNIFETIKYPDLLDVDQHTFHSVWIEKILNPFLENLTDKPLGEFTEKENLFVQKIIKPEIFNTFKQKMKSLLQMNGLIYDQSTFTNEFVEMLRKRKDFPFTNPQSTIGAFVKFAQFMENYRWCLDLKTS